MFDVKSITVVEAGKLLKDKDVSSVELTRAYLDRIDAVDPKITGAHDRHPGTSPRTGEDTPMPPSPAAKATP